MHVVAWRTEQEVGHNRNRVSKRFGIVPFSYRFEENGTLLWEKRTTIHHAEPYTKWKVSYKF
jgi:hypothetical protein